MKLKEARKARNLSVFDLGAMIGVTGTTISRYETGKRNMTVQTAKKLETILGVPWYELIDTKAGESA